MVIARGSRAHAVTGLSNSQIIIRPVFFNKKSGKFIFGGRPESSKRWYQTNDAPVKQKNFFVVVLNDGKECPVVQVCVNGLNQQFGKPLKVLNFGDALILVWDHPLLNWSNNNYIKIQNQQRIYFNSLSSMPIKEGW